MTTLEEVNFFQRTARTLQFNTLNLKLTFLHAKSLTFVVSYRFFSKFLMMHGKINLPQKDLLNLMLTQKTRNAT